MAKKTPPPAVTIIGGGLAGTEATFQLIRRGVRVRLYEMRGKLETGAHKSNLLGELVCSNSMGSNLPDRASGLIKEEMRALTSYILDVAYKYRVPAGQALAVDRDAFSREITRFIRGHSLVEYINEEATSFPTVEDGMCILATGPLTSPGMLTFLKNEFGIDQLHFFDAIAPVVEAESVDLSRAFRANRYGDDGGDYLNCPMSKEEYEAFVAELVKAERIPLPEFELAARKKLFSACQPVEEIAVSGNDSLRFGPLKPVGLNDPVTGRRPWAVVQLRQDNLLGSMYNLVGFQTNLKHAEQERVFRMIPALANAKFLRLGQMHKNTYLQSPKLLTGTLQVKNRPNLFLAGQLTGVEGYTESAAMGLIAGFNAARISLGKSPVIPPPESIMGALVHYITFEGHKHFAPMNANFGLFDAFPTPVLSHDAELEIEGSSKDDEKGKGSGASGTDRRSLLIAAGRRAFRQFTTDL
ncbi:MAG: methylenetetrahydrofolate--tRNA-(uracil(54)-C(5))-methyltransferase (FADH(2)-oxidizing) TrmFO [Candidatus Riflebacteria bacterium]|nr:methylenetetrahydrofolate--tRNA-(uracil(54)-C(5))-methyltransferase (FADH(2)-oxidizing) TrmFO [Candidatus Riflebacteria bacterium]